MRLALIFQLLFSIWCCDTARILVYIPTPSLSHQSTFHQLWIELSRRHQVVLITTNPIKENGLTNLTQVDIGFSYENVENEAFVSKLIKEETITSLLNAIAGFIYMVDKQMGDPQVQKFIHNSQHYDLLIVEAMFSPLLMLSDRFNCPTIVVTSLEADTNFHESVGDPTHPILYPDIHAPLVPPYNTFSERFHAALFYVSNKLMERYGKRKIAKEFIRKHFGDDKPSLDTYKRNISLLLTNTNNVFNTPRPLVPTVIQLGPGMHLKKPEKLPEDLQTFLDESTQGVIYFSLGTNMKSIFLETTSLKVISDAFAELPYKILWKFEGEHLAVPANVKISKWFPQQSLLAHKNVKLFITQGGLQSLEESIINHIPVVGMPVFVDQHQNILRMVKRGAGLSVNWRQLDKNNLKAVILEVIENPKYKNGVKQLAELMFDQPIDGVEKALWWTEYVLRHKGATHLRSFAIDVPLYQYCMLDIIAIVLIAFTLFLIVAIKMILCLFKIARNLFRRTKVKLH